MRTKAEDEIVFRFGPFDHRDWWTNANGYLAPAHTRQRAILFKVTWKKVPSERSHPPSFQSSQLKGVEKRRVPMHTDRPTTLRRVDLESQRRSKEKVGLPLFVPRDYLHLLTILDRGSSVVRVTTH